MCGIAGFIASKNNINNEGLDRIGNRMADVIRHRGPDDSGVWSDEKTGIVLGFRRLSIIDLTESGHQPMISENGRFVLILNGEIYNYRDLRKELLSAGFSFRGTSDTEVALCAIQHWGIEAALRKFVGMFALGIWDREQETLTLARDRLGEKPLYYGFIKSGLVFSSELKSMCAHPDWDGQVDRIALAYLVKYTYIPSPYCIYRGIHKLLPGTYVVIRKAGDITTTDPAAYWSSADVAREAVRKHRRAIDKNRIRDELDELLLTTIADKMLADVPVGAFLSGGIDSSLVVALMQRLSDRPVKTFSIGFKESEYNEAIYAQAVAGHLGTDHTELYVTPSETQAVIPKIPQIYDEPFADSSQIPTYIISELARREVTVALSGDGGDELFGGYTRYIVGRNLYNKLKRIPGPVRMMGEKIITGIPDYRIDQLFKPLMPLLPKRMRYKQIGNKLHKLARVWNSVDEGSIYESLISLWDHPEDIVIDSEFVNVQSALSPVVDCLGNFSEKMMYTDLVTYLPDDILVKVDRASMAVSLEVRVPFLDHRIVDYIWNQPPEVKIAGDEGKWLLRQVLHKYVPRELIDRPKMGFGVPIDHWLREPGEIREWAEELISYDRLKAQGYLNPVPIRRKWEEHLSGQASWHYQLWPIIMFQAWHESWMGH